MVCFICYLLLILYTFNSKALSSDIPSCPATRDFSQFAAGNFKHILTDACKSDHDEEQETTGGKKRSHNKKKQVKNSPRKTAKMKEILSMLEQLFRTNRTTSRKEGVYELHLLPNASEKGAVCLDGSPPGYYLRNGTNLEKSKWIIFFQGGAWCHDIDSCYQRSYTALGSSTCFRRHLHHEGLLSNQIKYNPDFYNWTSVFVAYCDGASFTGDRKKPVKFKNKLLYFRGRRILDAILDELLRRGIDKASEIILSGSSAGGISAIIHADYIRARLRRASNASFRVLADAGFFVDEPSINGTNIIRSTFRQIYTLHNSSKGLNQACLRAQKRKQKFRCFLPQYSLPFVKSPIFLVNSLYDSWQIPYMSNVPCICNLDTCSSTELSYIKKFRKKVLRALRPMFDSKRIAVFADSCFLHSQTCVNDLWTKVQIGDVTIAQAFANWYRGDMEERFKIDDPYPSNPTC
ncbi:uncharacterized protein LOC144628666 [Oculina patagonica]